MRSEHRETLLLHRQILDRQREINRNEAAIARKALEAEQSRMRNARSQHHRDLESAKAQAREYRVVWLQAKKDGKRLLEFADRHFKRAA